MGVSRAREIRDTEEIKIKCMCGRVMRITLLKPTLVGVEHD